MGTFSIQNPKPKTQFNQKFNQKFKKPKVQKKKHFYINTA